MQCANCYGIGYVPVYYVWFGILCFGIEKCGLCLDGIKIKEKTRYWVGGKEVSKKEFHMGTYDVWAGNLRLPALFLFAFC
jgi:hypothetical protein